MLVHLQSCISYKSYLYCACKNKFPAITWILIVDNFFAVNSSRGNKYYGECSSHSTDCLKPANREAASDTETDGKRWAPPLQVQITVLLQLLVGCDMMDPDIPIGNLSCTGIFFFQEH